LVQGLGFSGIFQKLFEFGTLPNNHFLCKNLSTGLFPPTLKVVNGDQVFDLFRNKLFCNYVHGQLSGFSGFGGGVCHFSTEDPLS
jgi:hypothetical protein